MKTLKIVKFIVSQSTQLIYFAFVLLTFQSCSKTDEPDFVNYTGKVWLYDGPEIGRYEAIDSTYLKPFSGIDVFIDSCEPWSGILGGGCDGGGRLEETDVTDSAGKFSILIEENSGTSYWPSLEYNSAYVTKSEGYSSEPYKEFIQVPRSLIR